jgi:hypothetical protein
MKDWNANLTGGLRVIDPPKYAVGDILCLYRNPANRGAVINIKRCGNSYLYFFKEYIERAMFNDANALAEFQLASVEELVAEKLMGRVHNSGTTFNPHGIRNLMNKRRRVRV